MAPCKSSRGFLSKYLMLRTLDFSTGSYTRSYSAWSQQRNKTYDSTLQFFLVDRYDNPKTMPREGYVTPSMQSTFARVFSWLLHYLLLCSFKSYEIISAKIPCKLLSRPPMAWGKKIVDSSLLRIQYTQILGDSIFAKIEWFQQRG